MRKMNSPSFDFQKYKLAARDESLYWVMREMTDKLESLIERARENGDYDLMEIYLSYRRPLKVGIEVGAEAIAAGLSRDEAIQAAVDAARGHADLVWGGILA